MNGIVVLAHGSREEQTQTAWRTLEQSVRAGLRHDPSTVVFQFGMDGLPGALDALVKKGVDSITILPYFLFTGMHLRRTVPDLMRAWQQAHPDIHLLLAPALGEDPRLAALLTERIDNEHDA